MRDRKGEKIGWTVGWIGGFLWVAIIAAIFLFQGKWWQGVSGAGLAGLAICAILFFVPWRFPCTSYWKLMLPPYGLFLASTVWAVWAFGGFSSNELRWWNCLWILPAVSPLVTLGNRKWEQADRLSADPVDAVDQQP